MIRHLITALTLAALPAAAQAATEPGRARPPSEAQSLFVELIVNGKSSETIVPLLMANGGMTLDADVLRKAGIPVANEGPVDVSRLERIRADYDVSTQTLHLDVAPELLPVRHVAPDPRERLPTVADYGAMLSYDAYMQRSGGATSASLWSEQRLFGPVGTLSNSGTIRIASGRGAKSKGYLRFDTSFRYIDENRVLTVAAGDMITQSLPWTRSFRLGGIQISRDFRIRPDLVTMPLPSFSGKTAVPSAVDLFVEGYHRQSTDIAPGRFVLDNVPVVTGAGQATIVTVDAVGRQISTTVPFYVSSELLRKGLLDFSAEAGFIRRNYGISSFNYGQFAVSGTGRYGLTQEITVEGHGEAARGHGLIGGGLLWSPWIIGTFNATASHNSTHGTPGSRWSVGYSYTSRRFSLALDHEERRRGFRDLGSFDLSQLVGLRRSDRVIGTLNLDRQGSLAAAYISGKTLGRRQSRIVTGSYSRAISRTASLFVSADYDLQDNRGSVQLRLVVPFGRNMVTGGISHDRSRGTLGQVTYNRSMPSEGGFGLDASIAGDDDGRRYGQATATWRARPVELQAGFAAARGATSTWASATGSIVTMAGDTFFSRRITDSFAVVSTEGVPGVPVAFENQPAGDTDEYGRLFVPNVTSYLPSRFAIDTLNLSEDSQASSVDRVTAVRQGAGAIIRFPIRKVRSATVALVDAVGLPLPPGSLVLRQDKPDSPVGWDGIAYLEDMSAQNLIAVTRADGSRCHATISLPDDAPPLASLGPVPCL